MELHWGKHVQGYLNNLNNLIAGTKFENASLDRIIKESTGALYNNAAQVWNHMFYFEALSPKPRKTPEGRLRDSINEQFGSLETFKEQFNKSSIGLFGSGWTWLVRQENGTLLITQEQNAGNPLHSKTGTPLLCADMWEHAYYMDYQNRRADYLNAFWEVLDWTAVEKWF
jgi:Fe-Mn family superoxide dismutase